MKRKDLPPTQKGDQITKLEITLIKIDLTELACFLREG